MNKFITMLDVLLIIIGYLVIGYLDNLLAGLTLVCGGSASLAYMYFNKK